MMRRHVMLLPLLLVALAVTGCDSLHVEAGFEQPTKAAAIVPTQAPQSTATTTEAPGDASAPLPGQAFAFSGVRVTLPPAVASGASGRIVPAAQAQSADTPDFEIHPACAEITLADYPAQGHLFQAMIQVFPVAAYMQVSPVAEQRVQALQALLVQKPAAPDKAIPMLPSYNSAQVLRAQVQYLDFENGAGVRFVTMLVQDLMPATNGNVFYTYQGLTSDGAYWVSALLPVNAAFLANADSLINRAALAEEPPTQAEVNACYQPVTDKMNETPAGEFTPSLEALDAMMQSLRVTAP